MSAAQTVAAALGVLAAGFALIAIGAWRNRAEPEQPGAHTPAGIARRADDIYAATIAVKPVGGTPPWAGVPLAAPSPPQHEAEARLLADVAGLEPLPPFQLAPLPARPAGPDALDGLIEHYMATRPAPAGQPLTSLPECAPPPVPAAERTWTPSDTDTIADGSLRPADRMPDWVWVKLGGRTTDQLVNDLFSGVTA